MILFDPAHPCELIRETLDGIYEENSCDLGTKGVAAGLNIANYDTSENV